MQTDNEYQNECLISLLNIKDTSYLIRSKQDTNSYTYYYIFDEPTLASLKFCPMTMRSLSFMEKIKLSHLDPKIFSELLADKNKLLEHDELSKLEFIDKLPWKYVNKPTVEIIQTDLKNSRYEIYKYEEIELINLTKLNLENAIIQNQNFERVDLSFCNLKNAQIVQTNCRKMNFKNSNLENLIFSPTSLAGVKFLSSLHLQYAKMDITFLAKTISDKLAAFQLPSFLQSNNHEAIIKQFSIKKQNLIIFLKDLCVSFNQPNTNQKKKAKIMLQLADLEYKIDLTVSFITAIEKSLDEADNQLEEKFLTYKRELFFSSQEDAVINPFNLSAFLVGALTGSILALTFTSSNATSQTMTCSEPLAGGINLLETTVTLTSAVVVGTLSSFCMQKTSKMLKRLGFFRDPLEKDLDEFVSDLRNSFSG